MTVLSVVNRQVGRDMEHNGLAKYGGTRSTQNRETTLR
jgi:hypothetical protein